ncbi:halocyanin domain-containing protein [Haloarchaeobius iranensis]|uniref:Halocyanin domain-containing protein n=1 Tax=Haloarchaeobius iranensis TaxID=996166 RepID=A0A1H0AYL6_9EURY|nr:halocyanin domain-containing protein [Haloarchaeobius iranensis]SDN38391.1 halocyanin domain-containing protein [Haloarchaeobius iranensis]
MSRQGTCTRRAALRALGVGAGLAATGVTATAQGQPTFDGWLDNVGNYDGVVDETGSDSVTVQVGSQANGGAFGFSPPAVRVDPGTEVVWEWTGDGGVHNVLAEGANWGSELVDQAGHTYSRTFEEPGVHKYFCEPHEGLGMKGVVVVTGAAAGGDGESAAEGWSEPTAQPRPVGESSVEPLELAFVGVFGSLLLFPALVGIAMGLGSDGRPADEPDGGS